MDKCESSPCFKVSLPLMELLPQTKDRAEIDDIECKSGTVAAAA